MQTHEIKVAVEAYAGKGTDMFCFALFEIFRRTAAAPNNSFVTRVEPPRKFGSEFDDFIRGVVDRAKLWSKSREEGALGLYVGNVSFSLTDDSNGDTVAVGFFMPVILCGERLIAHDFRVGAKVPAAFQDCVDSLQQRVAKQLPALEISQEETRLAQEILRHTYESVQRAGQYMARSGSA